MTEPMTDERRREMQNLFKEGGHGLCYNNVRAAGRDCLEMIDCLREELTSSDLFANLLRRTAQALGKPLEGDGSTWHDIPECAAKLRKENERYRLKISEFIDGENKGGPGPLERKYDRAQELLECVAKLREENEQREQYLKAYVAETEKIQRNLEKKLAKLRKEAEGLRKVVEKNDG